ncbi:DUF192 domain-containing protein [Candidatus Wolfebacteria bacterium]|nr:DUF192 domain-containing protein [Candidatus Wolfebacteria bacterium]
MACMSLIGKYFVGGIVALTVAALFFIFQNTSELFVGETLSLSHAEKSEAVQSGQKVRIGDIIVRVLIARTPAEITRGLSGRRSLDPDAGMLFVFEKADRYRFWMPDMRFPIDILWINDGTIVDIDADASNIFDPANPKFYTPQAPVRYVLEVNAGFAHRKNIRIGDTVELTGIYDGNKASEL